MNAKTRQERLREGAEEARRRDKNQPLMPLITLWAAGIIGSGIVVKKMVLVPLEGA